MSAFSHTTILTEEVVRWIAPRAGGIYADATLGGGGHAEALLKASEPDGRLIGVDRDETALAAARERLAPFGDRVRVVRGRFSDLPQLLRAEGIEAVDGLVADLGVSSPQLDVADRGFSFSRPGPLDMRMDRGNGPTARELIASLSERALADLLYEYGEERRSRPIARVIKSAEAAGELETTADLRRAVVRVLGPHRGGADPATRTFQALRIAVNDELGELDALLGGLANVLADHGVAAILSFHSLEDRRVKYAFRESADLQALTKKPIVASDEECAQNPRARSAKLRVARRIPRAEAA